jgi:hypothetical protein
MILRRNCIQENIVRNAFCCSWMRLVDGLGMNRFLWLRLLPWMVWLVLVLGVMFVNVLVLGFMLVNGLVLGFMFVNGLVWVLGRFLGRDRVLGRFLRRDRFVYGGFGVRFMIGPN